MNRKDIFKLLGIGALIPFVPKWLGGKEKHKSELDQYVYIHEDSPHTQAIFYTYKSEYDLDGDRLVSVWRNGVALHSSQYKIEGTIVTIL